MVEQRLQGLVGVVASPAEAGALTERLEQQCRGGFGVFLRSIPDGDLLDHLDKVRAELADSAAEAVSSKPLWCGECDERTRQIELDDGKAARCPRCHPARVMTGSDPAAAGP